MGLSDFAVRRLFNRGGRRPPILQKRLPAVFLVSAHQSICMSRPVVRQVILLPWRCPHAGPLRQSPKVTT